MPNDLRVVTEPHQGGYRYAVLQGAQTLITSGVFHFEADARRCGDHVASDPKALFDFLER